MIQCARRLIILMAHTGGGHRSAAEAIAGAVAHLYGQAVSVTVIDVLAEHLPFPLNRLDGWYAPFVTRAPWLWKFLWRALDNPQRTRWFFKFLRPWVQPALRRLFASFEPDIIVSVHPLLNHLSVWALRDLKWQIPFVTVVTDMVRAHPFWLWPEVDLCLVPTVAARQDALRAGLSPDRLAVVGQPVSLRFSQSLPTRHQARRDLGLQPADPVVLLMGGGDGVGGLDRIARAIDRARLPVQMVILTGRNEALRRKLESVRWARAVRVLGFINDVPHWMAAADILITRAGPGVISEAFIAGLPLVLSGAIPGQEEPNVGYAVQGGVGVFEPDPDRIVDWLAQRLQPGDGVLAGMRAAAYQMACPDASLEIARRIVALRQPV